MEGFIDAAGINDLQSGQMKMVKIEGHEILIARTEDKFYAADNRCPHMGGDLSLGILNGTIVTCPRHHSQFDLVDGHVVRWTDWTGVKLGVVKMIKSPKPLKTYALEIHEDRVLIKTGGSRT